MDDESYHTIYKRTFLDTSVVNLALDYGDVIHNGGEIPKNISPRMLDNINALCGIFRTGEKAFWQFAISPLTYREVCATKDIGQCHYLKSWFFELWHYWRELVRTMENLPDLIEAEETRISLMSSGTLDIFPDVSDRVLICDAVVYNCDCFCTVDWKTILRHRKNLVDLPLEIVTPLEWWEKIKPWASIWL